MHFCIYKIETRLYSVNVKLELSATHQCLRPRYAMFKVE